MLFSEWCESYLSRREKIGAKRPKTLKQDRITSKHLLRHLGEKRLIEISPKEIEAMYGDMRQEGVGQTTALQAHKLLKRVLKDAMANDLLQRNPCELVEAPRVPKPKKRSLERSEAARLAGICSSGTLTAQKVAVFIALASGARLGEVLGLEWQHLKRNEDCPYLYIVQQYTGRGMTGPCKTDDDGAPKGRVVTIDSATVAVLSAWKMEQRSQLLALGLEPGEDTPIITSATGGFIGRHNFENWWRKFCVANGYGQWIAEDGREIVELPVGEDAAIYDEGKYLLLWRDSEGWPCDASGKRYSRSYPRPKIKQHYQGLTFHELRHTHFSICRADGMSMAIAKQRGGWSDSRMLDEIYEHPLEEDIWQSVSFMDNLTPEKVVN